MRTHFLDRLGYFLLTGSLLITGLGLISGLAKAANPEVEATRSPTFTRDIAPIVFQNCASCHRPGQTAPFSLLNYQDVRKHMADIAEVTARRSMPPWLPQPGFGEFVGARLLTTNQIVLLQQWAAHGGSEGDVAQLPPLPRWPDGWQLGPPDLVVKMEEPFTLPAEGQDVYRNFVVRIPLATNRYVRAVEFRPGNDRIVHHAFLRLDQTTDSRAWDARDPGPGFSGLHAPPSAHPPPGHFLSWQPGKRAADEPLSWLLETNTDLVLQLHMKPTGKAEPIQSSVGFYFTDRPPTNTLTKIWLISYAIDIPAGTNDYVLKDSYQLPVDVQILAVLPHAHYLGKELQGYATLPDGTRQWLLRIPQWDFNWQGDYRYAQPVSLPKGTRISMEYHYDNSTNNVRNPRVPPQRVRYGTGSADEMGELWFQVLARNTNDLQLLRRDYSKRLLEDNIAYNEYLLRKDPRDAFAHLELGRLKLLGREPIEAQAHLRAAQAIRPDWDQPHYYAGLIARQQHKLNDARSEFEDALRLNPANYKAHVNLGLVLAEQGKPDLAETHFRSALSINPDDPLARQCLEELLSLKKRAAREINP